MDRIMKKQKGPGTSDHSLFRLQSKFKKVTSLITYYLTKFDDIKGFFYIC